MIITKEMLTKAAPAQLFFKALFEEDFSSESVVFEVVSPVGSSLVRTERSEAFLDVQWANHLAKGNKSWPNDVNPSRYKFVGAREEGNKLIVRVDPCVSYRDYIGGCDNSQFLQIYGTEFAFNPLATNAALLVGSEVHQGDFLMMTVRASMHDYKPGGCLLSFGGYYDIKKDKVPADAFFREVQEEAGILREEVSELIFMGVSYDPWTAHTDLVWVARASAIAEQILRRKNDKENAIFFVPFEKNFLQWFIAEIAHAVPTSGLCGVLLCGKKHFGDDWYARTLKYLGRRSLGYNDAARRRRLELADADRLAQFLKYAAL